MTDLPSRVITGATLRGPGAGPGDDALRLGPNGRLEATGPAAELVTEGTTTERLSGACVLPGLHDAHAHLGMLGAFSEQVDLRGCASEDELVERVRQAAAERPPGTFVEGWGWNQEDWPEGALPDHHALSAAVPDHPVLLTRIDSHATLVNAATLRLAAITPDHVVPPGGAILRDREGEPTGVFVDTAESLLPSPPPPSREQLATRLLAAQDACLRAGLTMVSDAWVDEPTLSVLEELAASGELKLRVNVWLGGQFDADNRPRPWLAERLARGPERLGGSGRLSIGTVKLFSDGALGSRGAALLEPYADRPETSGLLQVDHAQLEARLRHVHRAGFQAAIHAIGDAANRLVLDACEAALGKNAGDHRFRIEHAQVVTGDDIARFGDLGLIASVQPTHATSDLGMTEQRLGERRIETAHAWRSLARSGAPLCLGSDFPIEPVEPLYGVHAAVTRRRRDGAPAGGWRTEEALNLDEAIAGFTSDAAWAAFLEDELGSWSSGKRGDFVVLDRDPLAVNEQELWELKVKETWVEGERVFGVARD
ncbi:MAG: amidohydrolase [Acidobacteriota bacterium]